MAEPIRASATAGAVSLHSLPCTIHYSGPAPVSTYMIVKQEPLRAAFRGREMFGAEVHVPEGHQGVILREGGGQWNVAGRFSSFINWQRTPPPPNAPSWSHACTVLPAVRSAHSMIAVDGLILTRHQLHAPVTEDEVNARLKAAADRQKPADVSASAAPATAAQSSDEKGAK